MKSYVGLEKENICKMASNKDLEFDFEMLLLDLKKGKTKGKKMRLLLSSCLSRQTHQEHFLYFKNEYNKNYIIKNV